MTDTSSNLGMHKSQGPGHRRNSILYSHLHGISFISLLLRWPLDFGKICTPLQQLT